MTLLQAVVLGLIQGVTQFLPVSAGAHLRIVPTLFGWKFYGGATADPGVSFTAVVSVGTALALGVYFWRELLHVSVAWVKGLTDHQVRRTVECRLGWYLIVTTIPVAVLGVLFAGRLAEAARNLWLVSGVLIGFGVLLGITELLGRRRRDEEELDVRDAVLVGVAELIALVPGASRSGAMITAGLARGLTREAAVRFSFLLSIPAVLFFTVYNLSRIGSGAQPGPGAGLTGLALLIAFVTGLATLSWFTRWVVAHTTLVFVGYRLALGALVIVLIATGVLEAHS